MSNKIFRDDIQGLRAIAVMGVVVFHLWPEILPGGYVGVDVFFVISGFLISGHLISEFDATGKLNLLAFYSRRIVRLMPLALTVLLAVIIATYIFMPWGTWEDTSRQILASNFGFQNWFLASESVDYFASSNSPTAVQHYWSLSLEEQFYIFWPIFLLGLFLIFRKKINSSNRNIQFVMLAVGLLGFGYSIIQTEAQQSIAYFSTFTHIWEFVIGALVAVSVKNNQHIFPKHYWPAALLAISGFFLIIFSMFTFSGESKFPGYVALLPAAGVLLVLISGSNRNVLEVFPRWFMNPLLWVGTVSYAIYLWHWPPVVVLPYVLNHSLGNMSKLAVLLSTLLLAGISTRFIEAPL